MIACGVALIFFSERLWLRVLSAIWVLAILMLRVGEGIRNRDAAQVLLFPVFTFILVAVAYSMQRNWKNWP